jgi:hypothetical protein
MQMNRLYAYAGVLLVIVALSFTSCSLYKGKVAASVKADIAQEAISGAVVESMAQAKADAQAQVTKGKALDSVRPAIAIAREKYVRKEIVSGVPVDPWISVFNSAVRSSNEAVESASRMP